MEYVAGKSITEFCRAERLSSNDRMRLFTQVCRALEHAHQRGIIHRDLKPANILVCRGDNGETLAKVIDFGVAKAILTQSERNAATAVGALVGTIAYMSPEQLSGRTDAVDTRTDVYALGLILRELLSDAPAFNLDEMDQREAVAMLLHERPAPLGSVCPEFRGDASTIVDRAVAPLSADRYPSVAALRTDIELFLAGRPILSRSPGLLYVGGKFLRRNRTATSLSLIAILLTGGAVWKAWRAQSQRLDVAIKVAQAWFDETRAMERTVGESGKRGPLVERLAQQAAMFDAIDPNDPRVRAIHAAVLAEQGSVALGDGDFVKADAAYRAALQIREELARIAPGDHQRQMDLSIALVQVGDLAGAQQDAQTMLAFYNRALAIDESEASRLPENSRALSNLGWSFDRLAYHALYSGERDRAGELFRRECEVFSQEALLGPCVDAERGQSSAFCGLFYIADKGGPQSERLLYSHSCLEHIRTAFRLAPTDRHVLQSLVGAELTWLVARDMPDVGTNAFSEISDIVHHAQQLYDWDPSDLAALNMLATVLNKAVSVAQHVKESAAALRYSEQAVACAELLVARQPGDVDAQRLLVLCRTTHADAAKP
jgi:tetratricopeptide (TPR) repeat protein